MTHAERASIKRQMSIGEHPGENDLNANEFSVKTYIHVNGEKYAVTFSHGEVFTSIPGRVIIRDTLEQLRDAVIAALAAKPKAEPAPDSIAYCGIDWGVSPYMSASRLYNERQNDLYRRLMEVCSNQIVPPYER
jgi:hypothetical protein